MDKKMFQKLVNLVEKIEKTPTNFLSLVFDFFEHHLCSGFDGELVG